MGGTNYPLQRYDLPIGKAPLFLRRGQDNRSGPAVLFIHGGSASGDTFLEPEGDSIFDFLNTVHKMDVWLLDWRGSHRVITSEPEPCNESADTVAEWDIPEALKFVRETRIKEGRSDRIAVVGHCMGAACLAMAVGAGYVRAEWGLGPVVLVGVGLFYEVTWDGWSKTQDRTLDRVADEDGTIPFVTPDVSVRAWPTVMEETYQMWPEVWGPPWSRQDNDFFHRLAFMYGQPFLVSNLHERMTREVIRTQFGAIPFKLYRHAAQNALRGFAAPFNAEGTLDPNTENEQIASELARRYVCLEAFSELKITLITGAENPLWHRESIDRMAEWLARGCRSATKHVLDGYGHQDLWWGKDSRRDVFPLVLDAVRCQPLSR
jgi:pimeloyl-ACP methyl ester carboxylesterase